MSRVYEMYSHYKESGIEWIGKIPEEWEISRIKKLFKKKKIVEKKHAHTNILSLSYGKLIVKNKEDNKGLLPNNYDTYQSVDVDNIIFRFTDLQNDKKSLRVGIAETSGIITSAYLCIYGNQNINMKFAYYFFHNMDLLKEFYNMGNGIRQSLDFNDLKNSIFILPNLDEQKRIAEYLDKKCEQAENFILKQENYIELLKEQKKALINHAVTKGIDPDVELKESSIEWLGQIPMHWEVKKLKYLVKEKLKYGANESADLDDVNLPRYIRITDFGDNGKLKDETFKSLPLKIAKEYYLNEGDILFARSGATVGKTFQFKNFNGKACFAGYLIKVTPSKKILSDYLYNFTKSYSYEEWKNSIFNKATIENIGADKYNMLDIIVPSLEEQQKIVEYIEKKVGIIDLAISKAQEEIKLTREYLESLIYQAVTGQIRV